MRGFLGAAVALVVLDLVLQSPASRVAQALALPTQWLAKWMDANTPLLSGTGKAAAAPSANPANTPAAVGGANKLNGAPAGTPANPGTPPTGPHTIYPPGSQNL